MLRAGEEVSEDPRGPIERLSGLLYVTRLVSAGIQGEELRAAVAETVADSFGFRTVVINLRRPASDDFEVVTVHGSDEAARALLGTTSARATWDSLLDPRFEVAGAYFLPAGSVDWERHRKISHIPSIVPLSREDAWQPEDVLLFPLRHSAGELLGVLSVDEPHSGVRPNEDELAVLSSIAAHLAQALESAEANRARERLLEEVRRAERRYRSLVERLPAVAYRAEFGGEGRWDYVSPQILPMLGFSPEEWCGNPRLWRERIHPDDREAALAADEAARQTGEALRCEYRMLARDGRVVWVRDEAVALEESSGQMLHGVIYDVTAQKEAEAAIRDQAEILERTVRERTRELEEARVELLQRLAFAAEYRDEETYLHTERVGHVAALLAEAIGMPEREVELIRRAAPLHDIGKIGVPDPILLKEGRLDARERGLMRAHALIGAKMLAGSRSAVLQLAEEIALSHHERWDGGGYPRGLRGDEIPKSGRIVAIADVFDALTHPRPYRESLSVGEAVAAIADGAGTQFDPHLVEAFRSLDREALLSDDNMREPWQPSSDTESGSATTSATLRETFSTPTTSPTST
jgi:PAS domain S-box-containing protein/putative nucleotidyltransferase with HDIG domain